MILKPIFWMDSINKPFAMVLILLCAFILSPAQDVEHFVFKSNAAEERDKKEVYAAENLGTAINTNNVESGPFISPDGKTLHFFAVDTNNRFSKRASFFSSNIFFSEINDSTGKWGESRMMDAPLNCETCPNAVLSVVNSGNSLLLSSQYKSKGRYRKGLSISHLEGDSWSFPEPLKVNFKNHKRFSAFMNNDMNILILAIHGEKSLGEQDLFVSFSEDKVSWSDPINLGEGINTNLSEATVFLASDNKTIYFSSNGHPNGLGGFDVYKSERLDSTWTNWSTPENLGSPYNTPNNEFYFTIPNDAQYAYLAKRLQGSEHAPNSDVFRIELKNSFKPKLLLIKGVTTDAQTKKPIVTTFKVSPLNGADTILTGASGSSNAYKLSLPVGGEYRITFESPGYLPKEITVDASELTSFFQQKLELSFIPDIDFKLSGFIYHAEDARKINGLLEVKNKATGEVIDSVTVTAEKGYSLLLPLGVDYEIIASSADVLEGFYSLNLNTIEGYKHRKDFSLHCMNCSFELEDVLFVYNKAELLPESFAKLKPVLKIMLRRPDLKVELSAHTDAIGSDAYNKLLSQKRAEFLVDIFIFFGVPESQLVPVGYGEEKIRNKCKNDVKCTDEEHEYNRRVEFKILDEK